MYAMKRLDQSGCGYGELPGEAQASLCCKGVARENKKGLGEISKPLLFLVGGRGIEPLASSVSRKCNDNSASISIHID